MAKYEKYAEYKDSGAQWLGEVPNHWGVEYSKWLFEERNIKATAQDEMLTASQKYGVIPQKMFMELEQQKVVQVLSGHDILKKAEANDFVISMRSFQGGIEFSGYSGAVSSAYVPLKPRADLSLAYYKHLFKSAPYIQALQTTTNLVRDGQALRYGNFIQVRIPLVPLEEAEKIGQFLDHETAQIDSLITKQEKLIELLKEKRQAVISHAVTKGLNPDVNMKDSGVEWLGQVPEHWTTTKLKFVVKQIVDAEHKTAPYFEDGKYLVCRTTNVRDGKLRLEGGKYTNHQTYIEWTQRATPEIGDILFTREAPAGEACVYDGSIPLCLGQRMVLFKLNQAIILPEFLLYSLYSGLADEFIKQLSQGSTVTHFNMADIQNIPLFELPLDEQEQIIQYLKNKLNEFQKLEDNANQAIQLMQERRTALISSAVTGKIDVRNWQHPNEAKTELSL